MVNLAAPAVTNETPEIFRVKRTQYKPKRLKMRKIFSLDHDLHHRSRACLSGSSRNQLRPRFGLQLSRRGIKPTPKILMVPTINYVDLAGSDLWSKRRCSPVVQN